MSVNEGTWPEQNAVDEWFKRHSMELKNEVTEYRLRIQKEVETLKRKVEAYRAIAIRWRDISECKILDEFSASSDLIDAEAERLELGRRLREGGEMKELVDCEPCPCGDVGFSVVPDWRGEAEQQQCENCYTNPKSRFKALEAFDALKDSLKEGK